MDMKVELIKAYMEGKLSWSRFNFEMRKIWEREKRERLS